MLSRVSRSKWYDEEWERGGERDRERERRSRRIQNEWAKVRFKLRCLSHFIRITSCERSSQSHGSARLLVSPSYLFRYSMPTCVCVRLRRHRKTQKQKRAFFFVFFFIFGDTFSPAPFFVLCRSPVFRLSLSFSPFRAYTCSAWMNEISLGNCFAITKPAAWRVLDWPQSVARTFLYSKPKYPNQTHIPTDYRALDSQTDQFIVII